MGAPGSARMAGVQTDEPRISRLPDLGGPDGPAYALTFDDGPEEPWTGGVLDALAAAGVPATFFVLGSRIAGREAALGRMVDQGCHVEVHSWEHISMPDQPPASVGADIRRTADLIAEVTGRPPRFVRPPYGHANGDVIDQIRLSGMAPAFWSVEAADWTTPGTDAIVRDVTAGLDPGAVVLLHDAGGDRSQTVEAVPRIIAFAAGRGLRAVRLGG